MTTAPTSSDTNCGPHESCVAVPAHAIVMLAAGMIAAWFAAGSTGLLSHPFQHAIAWLALIVAMVAAWPQNARTFGSWVILAGSVVLGLCFTASATPVVNVLAVVIVLAAIAQTSRGLTGRVALIAVLGAMALGCFRFACTSIPTVWLVADWLGWILGRLAGWLTGNSLEVGATFGGIDFLILTFTIYAGWLVCTPPPHRSRAIWGAVAIIIGHFVYLIALSYSEKLLAILPDMVVQPKSETNHVGLWVWTNGLRTLIPWNMPLLALLIQVGIVVALVRSTPWLPIIEIDPEKLKKQKEKEEKEEIPGSVLAKDVLFGFGPALLAVAAMLLGSLSVNNSDLKGKTVVAYEKGFLNWLKPEYDSPVDGSYGMLQPFVESLGGKFVSSKELSEKDLASADVLLLIHPNKPWPKETLDRVIEYVRRGGSLLVVAEPAVKEGDSSSSFNDVLHPLGMEVRFDTAVPRVGNWEQSYDVMAQPATACIDDLRNQFGVQLGSSIRTNLLTRPTLVGRWGWSDPGSDAATTGVSHYNAGKRLGDLVLAAERPYGQGRVFVLGDTSPLKNEGLPNAFPFVGRLLTYLAHRQSSPQAIWRQLAALAALVGMGWLLIGRPAAWQTMLTATVMAVSLVSCNAVGYWSGRVLPNGRPISPDGGKDSKKSGNIAYIDASHLEAYQSDSLVDGNSNLGISELTRTLMRQGYLPLFAPDLTKERLERSGLLISIAPAREFSPADCFAVKQFVQNGGTFLCMVGAEEARASASLLAEFGFKVPHSPVLPDENAEEPEPLGGGILGWTPDEKNQGPFHAAWPVKSSGDGEYEMLVYLTIGKKPGDVVAMKSFGGGSVVVIGDTHVASNRNFGVDNDKLIQFWRWLLSRVVQGQKEWIPPAATNTDSSGGSNENSEDNQ